jgi:hypothetical protein
MQGVVLQTLQAEVSDASPVNPDRPITQELCSFIFIFLVSWGGVRLSSLGTSANIWLTVPAPDER